MIQRLTNDHLQILSVRVRQQGGRVLSRECKGRFVDFKDDGLNTTTNGCGAKRLFSVLYKGEDGDTRSAVACADDDGMARWPRWNNPDAVLNDPPRGTLS